MTRNCIRCDKDISHKSLRTRTCSEACRRAVGRHPELRGRYQEQAAWARDEVARRAAARRDARNAKPTTSVCATCGETFTGIHKRKYCSDKCMYARRRSADQLAKRRRTKNAVARTSEGRRKDAERKARRRARKAAAVTQRWTVNAYTDSECYWRGCALTDDNRVVDHVMPIALGGPHDERNTVPACWDCNHEKRHTHPLVWIAKLVEEA